MAEFPRGVLAAFAVAAALFAPSTVRADDAWLSDEAPPSLPEPTSFGEAPGAPVVPRYDGGEPIDEADSVEWNYETLGGYRAVHVPDLYDLGSRNRFFHQGGLSMGPEGFGTVLALAYPRTQLSYQMCQRRHIDHGFRFGIGYGLDFDAGYFGSFEVFESADDVFTLAVVVDGGFEVFLLDHERRLQNTLWVTLAVGATGGWRVTEDWNLFARVTNTGRLRVHRRSRDIVRSRRALWFEDRPGLDLGAEWSNNDRWGIFVSLGVDVGIHSERIANPHAAVGWQTRF